MFRAFDFKLIWLQLWHAHGKMMVTVRLNPFQFSLKAPCQQQSSMILNRKSYRGGSYQHSHHQERKPNAEWDEGHGRTCFREKISRSQIILSLGSPELRWSYQDPQCQPVLLPFIHSLQSRLLSTCWALSTMVGDDYTAVSQPDLQTVPSRDRRSVLVQRACAARVYSPTATPPRSLNQLPEKRIRCTKNKRAAEQVHFKFLVRLKNKNHSISTSSRNPAQRVWPEARGHCGAYRRGSRKMENSAARRRVAGRAWTKRGGAGKRGSESFLARSTGWSRSLRRRTLCCSLTGSICWPLPENKVLCYWVEYSPAQASGFTVKMLLVQPPEKLSQSRRYSTLVL